MINTPIRIRIDALGRCVIPKNDRLRLKIESGSEIVAQILEVDGVEV